MTIKSNIPGLYSKLVDGINSVSDSHSNMLIRKFNAQAVELRKQDGSLDISALNNFLNDGVYSSLFADVPETYQKLQNALAQMMNFGINMLKEMCAAVKTFRDVNVLGELKNIEETLTQTLLSNTEGMLIDKFKNNDMSL